MGNISKNQPKKDELTVKVTHIGWSSYVLLQTVRSIILGVVVFVVAFILIAVLQSKGVFVSVNRLLGAKSLQLNPSKLLALAGIGSFMLCVLRICVTCASVFVTNAVLSCINGVSATMQSTTVENEEK